MAEDTQTEYDTEIEMHLNPTKMRDNLCHCPIVEEDEMDGNVHRLCGGIRTDEVIKKGKRKKK